MLRTLARAAPLRGASLPRLLPRLRPSFLVWLSDAAAVRRQRNRLTDLDARMLHDIGVTDAEALREARRALWDVPDRWRR